MSWRARMVDFLFPPKCPFCRRVTEGQRVCPKCEKALPWTEGKEREQVLSGGLRGASPLWYEDLAREGILRFKFHGGAGAEVLELREEGICSVDYRQTEHYQLTRRFLETPERMLKYLFEDE